ncbi:MAG TPA: cytochrome c oxidase subunit 3 [Tepidisphaeraceae bacterium]
MSESILEHGYIPEEHAPDPVFSHGDPTPPGKVAIWLFLASEIMFFIGILGTYIILRSGSPEIFASSALTLNKKLAALNTLVLIFSSLTMALSVDAAQNGNRKKLSLCLLITFLMACGFMVIKSIEYYDKFIHHTIVTSDADGNEYVYDGHVHESNAEEVVLEGRRMVVSPEKFFDIHLISNHDIEEMNDKTGGASKDAEYHLPQSTIRQDITYGPWKNMFFGAYFALTGVHGLHVLGGMICLGILLIQSLRGKIFAPATEYVGLYWHFVDLVWIFLFPLLYLI